MRYLSLSVRIHRDRKYNGGWQGLGEGRDGEFSFHGYSVSVAPDEKSAVDDDSDGCTR